MRRLQKKVAQDLSPSRFVQEYSEDDAVVKLWLDAAQEGLHFAPCSPPFGSHLQLPAALP